MALTVTRPGTQLTLPHTPPQGPQSFLGLPCTVCVQSLPLVLADCSGQDGRQLPRVGEAGPGSGPVSLGGLGLSCRALALDDLLWGGHSFR